MGIINPARGEMPKPKEEGSFQYPRDFKNAPNSERIASGEYEARFYAWHYVEGNPEPELFPVAKARFRVA